jgi:hypothetical protein
MTEPFEREDAGQHWEEMRAAPVIGAFPKMSWDAHILADFIASAQAELHCARFDGSVQAVTLPRIAAPVHRGWARCWIGGRSSLRCRGTMVGRAGQERSGYATSTQIRNSTSN